MPTQLMIMKENYRTVRREKRGMVMNLMMTVSFSFKSLSLDSPHSFFTIE